MRYRVIQWVCVLVLMLIGSGYAGTVQENEYSQTVRIRFPEPIVPAAEVWEQETGQQPTLFRITGDARHEPTARWTDQDTLEISFPPGSSCNTRYQLDFHEDVTYLSGEPLNKRSYVFRCPPNRLSTMPIATAHGCALLVTPQKHHTREAQHFSEKSAVRYVFRQVKKKWLSHGTYLGRSVAATVAPARVRDGVMRETLERLAAAGQGVWGSLELDSDLPGHVLVQPTEELDFDETWVLCYSGEEGSGIAGQGEPPGIASDKFHPINELYSGVSMLNADEGAGEVEMQLYFSQPLRAADVPNLFARLGFSMGGRGTLTDTPEGRKLTTPDQKEWLLFRYAGIMPCSEPGIELPDDCERTLAYQAKGLARGMKIKVSGHLPSVVDVSVPQETTAANGAGMRETHVHRLALNPAWPRLLTADTDSVLPIHAEHKLRLPTANLSAVEVTVRRMQPQHYAACSREASYDSRLRDRARYTYRIHRGREREDLPAMENEESLEQQWDREEAALQEREQQRKCRMADATVYPTQRFDLGESAMLRSAELVLDMDALTGGTLKPGLYMVTLKAEPNAHVRHALFHQEQKADALNYELDIPVWVTDLNVICSQEGVLVTRYSDGAVVSDVSLQTVEWNEQTKSYEEKPLAQGSGVIFVQSEENRKILARHGQDVAPAWMPAKYRSWRAVKNTAPQERVFLLADRSLYCPGETVHVRGLVRGFKQGRACFPEKNNVKAIVRRPNGEELLSREMQLTACGGFELEITLPDGEEDVTGNYALVVQSGETEESMDIRCQVARRNAFAAELTVDVDKVAPTKVGVRVQADDYSGVPLRGAKVELEIAAQQEKTRYTLETDATGKAEFELPMKEEWKKAGELEVSGSICNDRAEYVKLEPACRTFFPADFCMRYQDFRIYADDVVSEEPLNREQRIRIRLLQKGMQARNPHASFSIKDPIKAELADCELTLQPQARRGVPLPPKFMQILRDYAQESPYDLRQRLEIEMTGTDAAGRVACSTVIPQPVREEQMVDMQLRLEPEAGKVRAHFYAPHKGVAHVFVGCGKHLRHVQQMVGEGEQTLDIALQDREEGEVSISLVLPAPTDGGNGDFCAADGVCYVPVVRQHLDLELQVPTDYSRPGQTVTLSGQVLAEGKPAQAEVTLYAVDEGMLALHPYTKPDPERFFAANHALTFLPDTDRRRFPSISDEALPAIWQGDMVGGNSRSLSPYFRRKYITRMPKSLKRGGVAMEAGAYGSNNLGVGEVEGWMDDTESMACAPAPMAAPVMAKGAAAAGAAAMRSHFEPLAVWKGALRTDADGRFAAEVKLPDTLTTYRVYAVAADQSGTRFGSAEERFVVNLPVMLTPGMPLFMSVGDVLQLPLSLTNATTERGIWTVSLEGSAEARRMELAAGDSGTLFFEVAPAREGEYCLQWRAVGAPGEDAVQGRCEVRFPAPLLKEVHRPEIEPGQEPLKVASLLAEEIAQSTRAEAELLLSASPVLHLKGCLDFLLSYPYGCTEQRASALMPWLLYDELAPFCPRMASTPQSEVRSRVQREIGSIMARQCRDGGLGYWAAGEKGSAWASAYAAMVLTVAAERGFEVPRDNMKRLLRFVEKQDKNKLFLDADLMAARALGEQGHLRSLLAKRCREADEKNQKTNLREGVYGATIRFLHALYTNPADRDAFRTWLKTIGHDYRHHGTADAALMMLALHEFTKQHAPEQGQAVSVRTDTGQYELGRVPLQLPLPPVGKLADLPTTLAAENGAVYALLQVKAQPDQTEFRGVTEKGLQVTRMYEVKDADGKWQPAPAQLKVGDVVRVTLTCAKLADDVEYLVLEDYLPACMEAINPAIPTQAAGLEVVPWSRWFDHREYLADRVRGFCTRWYGRDLLNMTYFARVKRAGVSTAPPAQAQLMYEPQTYGLSPNCRVESVPAL